MYLFTYHSGFWGSVVVSYLPDQETIHVACTDSAGVPFFAGPIDWVVGDGKGPWIHPDEAEVIRERALEMLLERE